MHFFIPQTTKSNLLDKDLELRKELRSQLGTELTSRQIFSLTYVIDKKAYYAEVGKKDPVQGRGTIAAIYESKVFIVYTRNSRNEPSSIYLVNKEKVSKVVSF